MALFEDEDYVVTEEEADAFAQEDWWPQRDKITNRLPHTCTAEDCDVTAYDLHEAVDKFGIRLSKYIQSRCKHHRS